MDTTTTRPGEPPAPERVDLCCDDGADLAAPSLDPTRAGARAERLADRLKALADPTRLRMLDLLAVQARELCVCDITSQFDLHQPTISHHLRILRQEGLINGEKRGVWSYYWATEEGKRSLALVRTLV